MKVVDTLPTGMSYVAAGTAPAPSSVVGNTITWNNVGPLNPLASKTITLVALIDLCASGTLTDSATATGTPPAGDNVTDSDTATVVVYRKPKLPILLLTRPQQAQYFTEKTSVQGEELSVQGEGEFTIENKIVDNAIGIDVHELIRGNGSFTMESKERLNESTTNRNIEGNYEHTKMIQFDSGVMMGTGRYSSSFHGGTGPRVEECFAVTEMQKREDVSIFTTTDVGERQVLDFDTMDVIKGKWGTRASWSEPCKKEIEITQMFDGDFEIQKKQVFEKEAFP